MWTYQRFHELVLLAVGSVKEPLAVARGAVQGAGRGGLLLEHHGRRGGRDDDVFLTHVVFDMRRDGGGAHAVQYRHVHVWGGGWGEVDSGVKRWVAVGYLRGHAEVC